MQEHELQPKPARAALSHTFLPALTTHVTGSAPPDGAALFVLSNIPGNSAFSHLLQHLLNIFSPPLF